MNEEAKSALLAILRARFEENAQRHQGVEWAHVLARLDANLDALLTVQAMEATGGEPDVVGMDAATGHVTFFDCSTESPDRRSLCYDEQSLASRKEHKPKGSALGFAAKIGAKVLDEDQYMRLQSLGDFDQKTSTWLLTPKDVRSLGGAIYGDRRFGRVFIYHNGAESYYASRGVRCWVVV